MGVCVQSCPTLCNTMDCNLPGSSDCEIFQARTLESVSLPSSRKSSWPRGSNQRLLPLLHWLAVSLALSHLGSPMYINILNHGNTAGLTLMASSKPNFLPKTPSANVATVGIGVSTYEFGSDTVESVAASYNNMHFITYTHIKTRMLFYLCKGFVSYMSLLGLLTYYWPSHLQLHLQQ